MAFLLRYKDMNYDEKDEMSGCGGAVKHSEKVKKWEKNKIYFSFLTFQKRHFWPKNTILGQKTRVFGI